MPYVSACRRERRISIFLALCCSRSARSVSHWESLSGYSVHILISAFCSASWVSLLLLPYIGSCIVNRTVSHQFVSSSLLFARRAPVLRNRCSSFSFCPRAGGSELDRELVSGQPAMGCYLLRPMSAPSGVSGTPSAGGQPAAVRFLSRGTSSAHLLNSADLRYFMAPSHALWAFVLLSVYLLCACWPIKVVGPPEKRFLACLEVSAHSETQCCSHQPTRFPQKWIPLFCSFLLFFSVFVFVWWISLPLFPFPFVSLFSPGATTIKHMHAPSTHACVCMGACSASCFSKILAELGDEQSNTHRNGSAK